MKLNIYIHAIILSLLPISELRGGIPYAVANDIDLVTSFVICVLANILVIPITYLFLETLHKLLYRIHIYQVVFDKYIDRTRRKAERNMEKYGYWGIMLFVAVPLPITGAYTGTIAAWLLKLQKRKSLLYLSLGVVIAGIIVSLVTISGMEIFNIFLKR
nr:small multi-drug export protein [candidate division Zixibacteria bacterium]